jgi:hypothetical protein
MIYTVKLPTLIRERLTDVVYLQMLLLRYAVSRTSLCKESCKAYIERHRRFRGRGKDITDWLWNGSARLQRLKNFAQHNSITEKRSWARQLSHEVFSLIKENPTGYINCYVKGTESWKDNAAEFLDMFYEYLYKGKGGLPQYFFSDRLSGETQLFKEDILASFDGENDNLLVCPVCGDSSRDEIDHYLPRKFYPHFSCHPFNLVPICEKCNGSDGKHDRDVLAGEAGSRLRLEDIFLPYHHKGLATQVRFEVRLERGAKLVTLVELKSLKRVDITKKIECYCNLYKMSNRWRKEAKKISHELYSLIEDTIKISQSQNLDIFQLRNILDTALYRQYEKQGKIERTFIMTWVLATLINQEVHPATYCCELSFRQNSAFLKQVAIWYGRAILHPMQVTSEDLAKARELRMIAKGGG